ncbi:uncharacterized protein LOC133370610 isoform X2 [Rhineura floridana]|uniref:uncharacterized protein LOC133370610 isoform X2 n=1 Tax=Rhineura floridana TaxID=261503 RepID=UPI002AC83BC6|nr:uncharacterized protein LOC133370610 isoform X2 [Rhineura floridana]
MKGTTLRGRTVIALLQGCLVMTLLLSDKNALVVIYRGCANKDFTDGAEPVTIGDRHFAIQSNMIYCLNDLCNVEKTRKNVSETHGQDKGPEASGSNHCFSGFALDPNDVILERVTCSKDYNHCYHGNTTITVGPLSMPMFIKTCQHPDCDVPQSQSFGLIRIISQWGSCCSGSYCNGKEVASQSQNISTSAATNASYGVNHTTSFTKPNAEHGTNSTIPGIETVAPRYHWKSNTSTSTTLGPSYDEYDGETNIYEDLVPTIVPRTRGSAPQGPALQLCPLLVALGITVLGIWW